MIDHVVYATADLDEATEQVADLFGVLPEAGGSHPSVGTRNLLLDLGGSSYLEIIGPDESQPEPVAPRPFDIDAIIAGDRPAGVVAWCARPTGDLESARDALAAAGCEIGPVFAMSRATPSGDLLEWRLTTPVVDDLARGYPFLIDWSGTPHPTERILVAAAMIELSIPAPPGWSSITSLVGDDRLRPTAGGEFGLVVDVDGRSVTLS